MHTKISLDKELESEILEVCEQTWFNSLSAKVVYLIRAGIKAERNLCTKPVAANSDEIS